MKSSPSSLPCRRLHTAARWPLGLLLIAMLLALAACGGGQPPAGGQEPVLATTPAPAGFVVMAVSGEAAEGRPALTVRFSQPLSQAQDLSDYLVVTDADGKAVDGAWIAGNDGEVLRFPYVKAGAKFKVEIRPGLVAADGSSLAEGVVREVAAVDLPAVAGFASQGSVLPSQGTDGLPLASVNVAEVDVEFFRVKPGSLHRFLSDYQGGGRRGYWELDQLRQLAEPVYLNRFIVGADRNVRSIHHLPVHQIAELAPPGLYFAILKESGSYDSQFETTYFVRSDIGVHLRRHADGLYVLTRSLATGEPLAGVALGIVDQRGVQLATASSDSAGSARLDLPWNSAHILVATRGEELSLLPFSQPGLDLSEFAVEGSTAAEVSIFPWSGRDLYRPGETVRVSALLRDFDGRPLQSTQPLYAALKQPDGRVFASAQLSPGAGGHYLYERVIPEDAPTGRWRLELSPDPKGQRAVQGFDLRIEEFLPERMKLALDSAAGRLASGEALPLQVEGAYLYGAPAAGNRFTAKLSYRIDEAPVAGLKGYVFGDATQPPSKEVVDAIDAALDDEGRLAQELVLEPGTVAGPVKVTVIGSVYETGGRPVTRLLERTLWPAEALVGIRPLFDPKDFDPGQDAAFEILKVRPDGTRVAAAALEVKLIREERDYTWNYDQQLGWRVDYTQRFVDQESSTLTLAGDTPGRASFKVRWGAYRIDVRDPESGLVARFPFEAGWGWDDDNRGLDARPDKVKLALDKPRYRAGDKLVVTVTPPHPGPGLLLVESDRLLAARPFEARAGGTLELEVGPEWERHDIYLTALVFRPGTARDKITPSRAVGIAHVPMDRAERSIEVSVGAPETMRPNSPLAATVSAPALAGQQAWVTVSAVDIGILNITRFPVPDALAHFFGKRRYAIEALDLYGRIIEAMAGERARMKFGGDIALPGLAQARRPTAKVLTVDLYSGPVQLDAQGQAAVELAVPDFNGALRVSAMVYGTDRYGSGSTETLVRAPLLAEVSTPRVMAPGDRALLTLDLHNLSGSDGRFDLRFEADAPIAIGEAQRQVALKNNERTTLRFPLSALADAGVGRFRLYASGPGLTLERAFEITVRQPHAPERRSRIEEMPGAGRFDLATQTTGLLPSTVRSRVSASTRVPLAVGALVASLLEYPYGCIEQTTSKGYPYVLLDEPSAAALGMPPIAADQRATNAQFAVDRVASMQLENGHYSFWPGDSGYSDPLITPYVVEFLMDAESAGFQVPAGVLQKSLERLRQDLLSGGTVAWDRVWGEPAEHVRLAFNAHAALVLARVNQAPLGTLRNLYDHSRDDARGPLPLMRLAVALKQAGDNERAGAAALAALGKRYQRGKGFWGDYHTGLGDRAATLALALEHGLLPPGERKRIVDVGREAQGQRWIGTHDTLALLKLARAASSGQGTLAGQLVIGGIEEGFATSGWFSRDLVIEDLRAGAALAIEGDSRWFLVQETVGIPAAAPPASSNGVAIEVKRYRLDGTPFDGDTLVEGERLVVHLRLRSSERLADALVVDHLAGGLEIENLNLMDSRQLSELVIGETNLDEWRQYGAGMRFEEFREDRYVAAVNLQPGSAIDLYYLVRAVSPGEYLVPGAFVEDMYRPELRAVTAAGKSRLKVVQPQ